jgi:hypothetical protein
MLQPWTIGVCGIDLVFVTELSVVIFLFSYSRHEYKNSIQFGKIHLLFRIMLLIQ